MYIENYPLLYKCVVGSTAYGLNTENSDVDIKGIYLQDAIEISCGRYVPQLNVGKDEVYYELNRFLELIAEKANPTLIEMLFVDASDVLYCHPRFEAVLELRDRFLTKKCKDSFAGMAIAQIKKARSTDKMMNWEQERFERKGVLDFCQVTSSTITGSMGFMTFCEKFGYDQTQMAVAGLDKMKDCYELFIDENRTYTKGLVSSFGNESNELKLCSIPKGETSFGVLYFNKDAYMTHCKEYKLYKDWIEKRNMNRFVETEQTQKKVDSKNLMHCCRLIDMAIEVASGKKLIVKRPNKEFLLSVRRGEVEPEELIEKYEALVKVADELFENSKLPECCEVDMFELKKKVRFSELNF